MEVAGKKVPKWVLIIVAVLLLLCCLPAMCSQNSDEASEPAAEQSVEPSPEEERSESSGAEAESVNEEPLEEASPEPEPIEPVVDKTSLQSLINEAESLETSEYTRDSYDNVSSVYTQASATLSNDDATQEEVDAAVASIEGAIAALVAISYDEANYPKVSYDDIARNPEDHRGNRYQMTGSVIESQEDAGTVMLRIATSTNGYDDIILVTFDSSLLGGSRILEDDNVTVYGISTGIFSYESVLGATISVPSMLVENIEVK